MIHFSFRCSKNNENKNKEQLPTTKKSKENQLVIVTMHVHVHGKHLCDAVIMLDVINFRLFQCSFRWISSLAQNYSKFHIIV